MTDGAAPARAGWGVVRAAPWTLQGVLAIATLEALALLAAAGYLLEGTVEDHPTHASAALGAAAFALLGAGLIGWLAYAVLSRRLWARTPLVVLQLVFIPVGFSIGVQAGRTAYGVPILVLTIAMLALLALPESRAALLRDAR
ncbi:MAG: hypothetical protein ACR2F6_10845 [Mycobacteriales bacterium]